MLGLAPHIHCASIDDRAVILDARADRYRLVTGRKARALRMLEEDGSSGDPEAIADLVGDGILSRDAAARSQCALAAPERAALDLADSTPVTLGCREMTVAAARIAIGLRAAPLHRTLAWVRRDVGDAIAQPDATLIAYAHAFERTRLHVPLRRICLRDAALLARLLARRAVACRMVLGVRLDPFGAHSWVQAGDLVLTGTLGAARELTPILIL